MNELFAALAKEWLLQSRALAQLLAVLVFGATALLLFSFAVGPNYELLRSVAPGFLWLGAAALLDADPGRELPGRDGAARPRGQLLLPASPAALYYAKALANWAAAHALGRRPGAPDGGALRRHRCLRRAGARRDPAGTAGLSAPGTLYAAMTSQAGPADAAAAAALPARGAGAARGDPRVLAADLGDPMGQIRSWVLLLDAFDAIYWSLCGLLFGRVVED
jgi:hypothetical protein